MNLLVNVPCGYPAVHVHTRVGVHAVTPYLFKLEHIFMFYKCCWTGSSSSCCCSCCSSCSCRVTSSSEIQSFFKFRRTKFNIWKHTSRPSSGGAGGWILWRGAICCITPVSISYWFFLEPPLCWMTETIFIWRFCCSIWRDTFLFVYVYWEMAENFIFWKFPNMSLYQETLRWLLTVESIELLSKN